MIFIDKLSFTYPGTDWASLHNVSLQIADGETVSIMGANGSGKTTLARCLNGLLLPTSGRVMVNQLRTDLESDNEQIRQLVGMVFQNPDNQIVSTSVEREIAFGLENLNVPHEHMIKTVDNLLAEFNLERYRKRSPHYLSGGEKQLLALAAVLAMTPAFLILDEPTSLLDPFSRQQILQAIFRNGNSGLAQVTPILITQYPEETFFTERLIVLDQGQVIFDDSPRQVFNQVEELNRIGIGVPVEYQLRLGSEDEN